MRNYSKASKTFVISIVSNYDSLTKDQQHQIDIAVDNCLSRDQIRFMANPSFDPRMMAVIRKDFEEKVLTDEQIMLYTRKANDYMSLLRSRAALIGQIKANERSRKNLRNKTTSRSAVASRSVNSSVAMARKAGVSESRIMHNSDELRRWLGGGR